MKKVFLGLGANLGNREENLKNAVVLIREHIGPVKHSSSIYETEPWGFQSKNYFLNMVVEVETSLRPSGLLGRILMIESLMGRVREGREYKSRTLDIDILLYGSRVITTRVLQIPHPLMNERKFVLVPLTEIAGEFLHPVLKKSIQELLDECPDNCRVKKFRKL